MNGRRDEWDTVLRASLGNNDVPTGLLRVLLSELLAWSRRSPRWLFRILWGQEKRPDALQHSTFTTNGDGQ